MTRFVFIPLSILLLLWSSAVRSRVQDDRSTELLNKVTAHYSSFSTMKVAFSVKMDDALSETVSVNKGSLDIKGEKFRIKLSGQEVICDGTTMWTYIEEANEVTITQYDPANMDISPSNIFRLHESGFLHRYAGQKTVVTQVLDLVELTPTDKSRPYFKISMYIKANGSLWQFEAKMKSGMTTSYMVNSFKGNETLEDGHFTFKSSEHPGVVEVDLR